MACTRFETDQHFVFIQVYSHKIMLKVSNLAQVCSIIMLKYRQLQGAKGFAPGPHYWGQSPKNPLWTRASALVVNGPL
jgi:hypothetical protein